MTNTNPLPFDPSQLALQALLQLVTQQGVPQLAAEQQAAAESASETSIPDVPEMAPVANETRIVVNGRRTDSWGDYVTVDELAVYLQVAKATIYTWHGGENPPPMARFGKHVRYPRYALIEWIEQHHAADLAA